MWSKQVENEVLGELYRVFDQWAPSSLNMEKNEKKNILFKKKNPITMNNYSRDLPQFSIYFV
jgi:hypothetical protein